MKKSIFSILLATVLTTSVILGGCGSKDAGSSNDSSASSGDTIKLGQQCDLSGDMANPAGMLGAQLAVKEINEAGGVLGKQLELIVVDTQTDTTRYQEMTKKLLLQDEVKCLFGYGTSAAREVIRPIVEENDGLYFYNSMYEDGVASKNVVCTGMVCNQQIYPLMQQMADMGLKKVYVLFPDYNYGHICAQWVERYADELGLELVAEEFEPISVSEFSGSISKIRELDPDCIFVSFPSSPMRSFWEQWAATGLDIPAFTATNISGYYEHVQMKAPALADTYTCSVWMEEFKDKNEACKEFVDKIYASGDNVDYVSHNYYMSYQAIYLWAAAAEKAGSAEPADVIAAIEAGGIKFDGPVGEAYIIPETHHVAMPITLVKVNEEHGIDIIKEFGTVEPTWLRDDMHVDLSKMDLHQQFTLEDSPLE